MKKRGNKNLVVSTLSSKSIISNSSKKSNYKKLSKNKSKNGSANKHPAFRQKLTFGQKAADRLTRFGGSWVFIGFFFFFIFIWMIINIFLIKRLPFDPYPFILLNLILSCLAAVQAPIILMAQNRQMQRDRIDEKYDHIVNRKAEREIQAVQKQLDSIKLLLGDITEKVVKKK